MFPYISLGNKVCILHGEISVMFYSTEAPDKVYFEG